MSEVSEVFETVVGEVLQSLRRESMFLLHVMRYACEAEFSNASGSVPPERMDTERTDIDAFKSDTFLMVSAANPGTCADVAGRG